MSLSMSEMINVRTVQSLYNTPHYNTDLDITHSCNSFHGILQRNYRKMTIEWSFSYNSFVKLPFYNMVHL